MFETALTLYKENRIEPQRMGLIAFYALGDHFYGKSFIGDPRLRLSFDELITMNLNELAQLVAVGKYKRIKKKVSRALSMWLAGEWKLELLLHVPSVYEVLKLQAGGARCVTLYPDRLTWDGPKLTKENALHFFVHDLEHAVQFFDFYHPEQLALNRRLLELYDQGYFSELMAAGLKERVDYLLSDMNTHPEHSYQFLQAIWYDHLKAQLPTGRIEDEVAAKMEQL